MPSFTLLVISAHPDDEISCGGTLAKYAAAGARSYVACATRGDGVDAQIKNEAATRETLGQVRLQELAASCATLGIEAPLCLHYQDGEVDKRDVMESARGVAELMRELKPDVVFTHDPLGGYGHPDHIAVSHIVTAAFDLAGDPKVNLSHPPHQPRKLYYWAFPRSFMEHVPGFRDRRADIRGQQLGFVGVPDEAITTTIHILDWAPTKLKALACHRTQFDFDPETGEPKTFATSVPEPARSQMFGWERFILARHHLPHSALNGAPETDILAGLA